MELIGNENKIESKSDTHKNLIVIDNFFSIIIWFQ